jgi:hypothetical protein
MSVVRLFFIVTILLIGVSGITTISISEAQVAPKSVPENAATNNEYADSSLLNIPLVWKPTETISALDAIDLTAFQNISFTINPFNDLRKKPSEIGKNVEKRISDKIRYVTTRDNVAAWLTDRFGKIISEFDITVVNNGGTLLLEADIVKFYVTEESVYKADIALKIRIRSKNGDVLWEGMASVSSNRWGKSYQADNYNEALSNACIDVVYNLLKSDSFVQAIRKHKST